MAEGRDKDWRGGEKRICEDCELVRLERERGVKSKDGEAREEGNGQKKRATGMVKEKMGGVWTTEGMSRR